MARSGQESASMTNPLRAISSMATRQLLAELAAAYARVRGRVVQLEAVGGVDAAKRVAAGEAFDAVVLASDAIDRLAAAGAVVAGSRVDIVRSPVALAVRRGALRPDIGTVDALAQALRGAGRIGYSTGPSGSYLVQLCERLGVAAQGRLVQASPGVPVAALLARGECDLGFQQLAELIGQPGVDVVGLLPRGAEHITPFAAGLCASAASPEAARDWIAFLNAPEAAETKRRHGMEPCRP
jgi:molybdate transport system substrate-binding protein